jgi:two-component system C4-dicarboxylate transport response regulator DctD
MSDSQVDEVGIHVIFIDDDKFIRKSTVQSMQMAGFEIDGYAEVSSALPSINIHCPSVIVSNIKMPGITGLELLQRVKLIDAQIPVILITGQGDIAMAVQAMRDGAYHFLEKPFSPDNLIEIIRRAHDKRQLTLENRNLKKALELQSAPGGRIIGNAASVQQLRKQIARLADTNTDILIWGETGTGKDLVARNLHEVSKRRSAAFVAINCGALPENIIESELFGHAAGAFTGATKSRVGKFEYANGGTIFLDEIESMPLDLQVKLLRVLQERVVEPLGSNRQIPIDIRVIAATKIDLKLASKQGLFRQDLYYRLNVITLNPPSLRDRVEDIPLLYRGQRTAINRWSIHGTIRLTHHRSATGISNCHRTRYRPDSPGHYHGSEHGNRHDYTTGWPESFCHRRSCRHVDVECR